MIRAFLLSLLMLMTLFSIAQNNVGINNIGTSPDPSAMLDVSSTTKGMLIPRMTTSQRGLITSPAVGLLVFDTDTETFWFKETGGWTELVDSGKGLRDKDQDTRIEVESATDDDTIRFVAGGLEMAKMDGKTLHLEAPGNSLFLGHNAGANDDGTNNNNTFIGISAGHLTTTGGNNIFLGVNTGYSNLNGGDNVFIGNTTGYSNTSGSDNIFIGSATGQLNADGSRNTFVGASSALNNTSGNNNIAMGHEALYSNTTGSDNIAIGKGAMITHISGSENVSIGSGALSQSQTAFNNTAIGYSALTNTTIGQENTAVGHKAMFTNSSGQYNVAIGVNALLGNTIGYSNTALGHSALRLNQDGYFNVAVGVSALDRNNSGESNTAIGTAALEQNTTGNTNVAIGMYANRYNQSGNSNTIVGFEAGRGAALHNKSGSVFIGYQAGREVTTDNKLYIENSSSSSPLIFGDFTNGSELVGINGSLGIGTQAPLRPLHVKSDGIADSVQTIVAVLESEVSNRPVLLFSETGDADFNDGMSIEYNGAAGTGSSNELYINGTSGIPLMTLENSGDMGIGTTEPSVPLQVDGGSDASLTGGGYFMTNSEESTNIVIDNNEIMARDSGSSSTLYLQGEGGAVNIHGNLSEINQIHIRPSGYVGIGEVDVISDKLTVNAATGTNAFWVGHDGGTAFRVCANGGVTIGYLEGGSGPSYALQLYNSSSNMIGKARAYAWDTYSDGRFKHDQRPLGYGLDEILRLQPKSYVHQSAIDENRIESRDIGLIAQEIYPIVPEIVYRPDDEEYDTWSVDYTKLIPLLINAIQEQQSMISHLHDQIEVLKSQLNHQD